MAPDEIWEHKRGRVWLHVRTLEFENRRLRCAVRELARERRRLIIRSLKAQTD